MSHCQLATFDASRADVSEPASAPAKTYFFFTAETGAGLLPRVLQPFTRLGLIPYRVHASTEQGTGEEMSVELRFARLPVGLSDNLADMCRVMPGMRSVLMVVEPE